MGEMEFGSDYVKKHFLLTKQNVMHEHVKAIIAYKPSRMVLIASK